MWWLNIRESRACLSREEKTRLSCHPQGLRRPRLPPKRRGDRSSGAGHPDAPLGRVSAEDLPAWRQEEKRACGGVDPEPRQGGWGPPFQEHHEGETTGITLPPA